MERRTNKCEALHRVLEENATSKENMEEWESLILVWTKA
jgi:hypothetical protein